MGDNKSFKAKIYKIGINWAVDVPASVVSNMIPDRGYINVEGEINKFAFSKNLVPVKNRPYRLFVDALMMDGGQTDVGKIASFTLTQIARKQDNRTYRIANPLRDALKANNLQDAFKNLTPGRKKNILRYLSAVKSEETVAKNVAKVIAQLKAGNKDVRIP